MTTAYFSASIDEFHRMPETAVLGTLLLKSEFHVEQAQRDAWLREVVILRSALIGAVGTIHLEFIVPRIGSRIDAVVILGSRVFVIEFKVGERDFRSAAMSQVWDYALDLKNFHSGSHAATIVPILVATESDKSDSKLGQKHGDGVFPPVRANQQGLRSLLLSNPDAAGEPGLDGIAWAQAEYRPTPTIVEAAQALFSGHSVEAIARHEAGIRNLHETSRTIGKIIERARTKRQKAIIFVTGVPGAGKTLVGLNIATHKIDETGTSHAVYLSGNGPLVAVLRAALARDAVAGRRIDGRHARPGDITQRIKAFIQNVHHFRDAGLNNAGPPSDHVVVFDEAQRAWDRATTIDFMKRKKKRPDFHQSEPEFLLSCLDRHEDWAVVVCLVGGGQEINRGEAGIGAWLEAVRDGFPNWHVLIAPELVDAEYAAANVVGSLGTSVALTKEPSLHLAVSVRSFRSENVSRFVKAVLDVDQELAQEMLLPMLGRYPIALTRNLASAKGWVRRHARGSERFGLLASSGAQRLKPHAIDVRVEVNPVHWFLGGPEDTRSSYYLEDAATEFQVQGLEVDWACVTWDADLRFVKAEWNYHSFRGSRWTNVHAPDRQQYLRNAYRVLLTRARQGMVICVPYGDKGDSTRDPKFYDSTYEFLAAIGIPLLDT